MKKIHRDAVRKTILYLTLSVIAVLMVGPFLWSVSTSLKTEAETFVFPPTLFSRSPQWSNYLLVLRTAQFPRYFLNTAIVTISRVLSTVAIASLAGYAFARLSFPMKNPLFLVFLSGMMIPPQVIIVPMFLIIKQLKWIDTYGGLIAPGLVTPFAIFVFRQFFLGIPKELEQAATIDGCTHFQIFTRIISPLSKPAFATMAIFRFVNCWNELLWPLIITNSEEMRVLQVGLTVFKLEGSFQYNLLMAAAAMAVIPTLVLFLALQRYFVKMQVLSGLKL